MAGHPSAIAVIAGAMAAVIRPQDPMLPSTWARGLVVPDGPRAGELWDASLTPYILEPLDLFGPDSGENEFAVMKSAQTGFTTLLVAAAGYIIDRDPCRFGIIQPTDSALSDFNREKLQPAIESTPALARRVKPQTSRSATGSTTYSKAFSGGSCSLLIASSASDLRSKTLKILLRDEIDQYPDDLDGQGNPLDISDGRQMAFRASGDWRKCDISTPTIKGGSKIEARYEAGDKRRWHVSCPHCTGDDGQPSEFVFEFGPNFRFERQFPHRAHYVAPCCGAVIEPHERTPLVRRGRWIATAAGPGRYPSYHFDALSSPFVPWDDVAKAFIAAGDDPMRLKAFWNLWLGLPFEMKGDAPDIDRLMERREDYRRYTVPPRGLLLTAAADVQMRGIWYEIVAHAPNGESWTVDAGYCDGDTSDADGEAFVALRAATLDRTFQDAFGRERQIDALGVDSGYRSHVVYTWVRRNNSLHPETGRERVLALKGRDGWGLPAIGTPVLVDIDLAGRKIRQGCKLWAVGTWPLKGAFYDDLRKDGLRAGRERDPDGYCHFGAWLDTVYFDQITAEYVADEAYRGRSRKVWKVRNRDNHLLDCRVYNKALAEYLGLSSMTSLEWAAVARARGLPDDLIQNDIFTAATRATSPQKQTPAPRATPSQDDDWMRGRGQDW